MNQNDMQNLRFISNKLIKLNQERVTLINKQKLIFKSIAEETAVINLLLQKVFRENKLWEKIVWVYDSNKSYWTSILLLPKKIKLIVSYIPLYTHLVFEDFQIYKTNSYLTIGIRNKEISRKTLAKKYNLKIKGAKDQ